MKDFLMKGTMLILLFAVFILPGIAFKTLALGIPKFEAAPQEVVEKKKTSNYLIEYDDTNGKIFVDDLTRMKVLSSESIKDGGVPAALINAPQKVTGSTVKENFKAHEKDIMSKKIIFEIITQDGENLFFKNYDELKFFVNDKDEYEKTFVLDKNKKLVRYTYLAKKVVETVEEIKDDLKDKKVN